MGIIYFIEIVYEYRAAYHQRGGQHSGPKGGPECILAIYFVYKAIFLQKAVKIMQRYKAELFSIHYWSNHGVQPGQQSGPDWYYAIISNILDQIFDTNFIWFLKYYFESNSLLTNHHWSSYNLVPGQKSGPECILAIYFINKAIFLNRAVEMI